MASPSTAHIPVLCLSHSGSTLGGTDGHGAFVYTFGSDQPPRRVGAPRDASGQGELKSELVRLVAVREATEGDGKGASKTGIVTTVSEDKHISTFEAESGRLLYQRWAPRGRRWIAATAADTRYTGLLSRRSMSSPSRPTTRPSSRTRSGMSFRAYWRAASRL